MVKQARLPSARRLVWIVLCLILLVPFASEAQDWKERIDHLWKDANIQTPTAACQMYPVRTLPPLLRDGDRALAGAWLRAGYCGDKKARQEIAQAGDAAVDYAVKKFGPRIP
jgi:hypothetical protein